MTWLQTASGRRFDFATPGTNRITFAEDVAGPLARLARFGGHVPSGAYSVAQHCVLGSDALLAETGNAGLAAAFLLHDAHEAFIGDMPAPLSDALSARLDTLLRTVTGKADAARARFGRSAWALVWGDLKTDIDTALYAAAGLPLPDAATRAAVKTMDLRMLVTERAQLMARPPAPWDIDAIAVAPVRLTGRLTVWPWPKAADEWMARLRRYCPAAP